MSAPTLKVELYLGGVWTDVTTYARVVDNPATIKRGRPDEASAPQGAQLTLTFNNTDGRFSPRNASGAYYGQIGRNTPIRVSVLDDHAVYKVRFWGVVSEWPVSWDPSGNEVTVSITGDGLRRRLQQGATPLHSPYYRAVSALSNVLAWWPMEDGSDATSFSSPIDGVTPMGFNAGAADLASNSDFVAAAPLPSFTDNAILWGVTGYVPAYLPGASGQQVRMLFEATGASGNAYVRINTSGAHQFLFTFTPSSGAGRLDMLNYASGAIEATNGPFVGLGALTTGVRLSIELKQNGTGIDCNVVWLLPGTTSGLNFGVVTIPSATLGLITNVQVFTDNTNVTATFGHVTVENNITSIFDLLAVLDAYAGETAADRTRRLCTEQGVPFALDDARNDTEPMGAQGIDTFLNLFDEAATADGGVSTELVYDYKITFRARTDMYSQSAGLTLAYTDLNGLTPVDDDQLLENDVTVVRKGGSSTRAMDATGDLGTAAVGAYAASYELSLYTDDQTTYQADWRLAKGTVDSPRFPVVAFDATKLTSGQRDGLFALREGDKVTVTDAPAFTGADAPFSIIVDGWTETVTEYSWQFVLNGTPADAFEVVLLDDATYGRLDFDAHNTLNSSMTTTGTTLSLATATGGALATTAGGDMPYDIVVDGERMTVTAASGSSSPQTLTVTRSVNGVVKTHSAGAAVVLAKPNRLAL